MSVPLSIHQWNGGAMRNVPIDQFDFTQHAVDPVKVKRMAAALKRGVRLPPPTASMANGRVQVQDGHNRAAAHISLGRTHVQMRIY